MREPVPRETAVRLTTFINERAGCLSYRSLPSRKAIGPAEVRLTDCAERAGRSGNRDLPALHTYISQHRQERALVRLPDADAIDRAFQRCASGLLPYRLRIDSIRGIRAEFNNYLIVSAILKRMCDPAHRGTSDITHNTPISGSAP